MPTVPSNMIAPPAGDPEAQDAVPTMGRRQPAWRARLNPDALWKQLTLLNMTQNELARRAKISSGYLSQLISGTRFPSARVRKRLQKQLGVTRFEDLFLLEWTGEETTDT